MDSANMFYLHKPTVVSVPNARLKLFDLRLHKQRPREDSGMNS